MNTIIETRHNEKHGIMQIVSRIEYDNGEIEYSYQKIRLMIGKVAFHNWYPTEEKALAMLE